MATTMNFQSLNYGGIAQQEQDARRRYYDSLSSIGGVIKDTGKEYEDYLARKKAEEDEKRKWDNMIAEQEYRKQQDELARKYQEQRDLVADTRYDNEYAIKQNERMLQEGALKNMKGDYGNIDTNGMTPEEIGYIKTIANAPTYADAIKAQDGLNQYRYQTKMLQMQQEQNERAARIDESSRQADDFVNQMNDLAAREGIDLSRGATLPSYKDKKALEALKANLEEKLAMLNDTNNISKHSVNSASMVMAINSQIKEINRRLGIKPGKKKKWRPEEE